MNIKEYLENRIKLWEEFRKNFNPFWGRGPHDILEKLGYEAICSDWFYDDECAEVIIKELKKVLELVR